jgi:hypothetical protein
MTAEPDELTALRERVTALEGQLAVLQAIVAELCLSRMAKADASEVVETWLN